MADGVYNRSLIPFCAKDKNARSYILPIRFHGVVIIYSYWKFIDINNKEADI